MVAIVEAVLVKKTNSCSRLLYIMSKITKGILGYVMSISKISWERVSVLNACLLSYINNNSSSSGGRQRSPC